MLMCDAVGDVVATGRKVLIEGFSRHTTGRKVLIEGFSRHTARLGSEELLSTCVNGPLCLQDYVGSLEVTGFLSS